MATDDELGLRARKKLSTRRAINDAALDRSFELGLENVRREDITARADVSPRTFTNYFADKYEAISYRQAERIQRGAELLADYPPGRPLWEAITSALLEPFESEGAVSVPSRRQLAEIRQLLDAPELHRSMIRRVLGPDGQFAAEVARRTETDPAHDMYPRLVVGAIAAAVVAAFETYARSDPPEAITVLLRRALHAIAAGLPVRSRQPARRAAHPRRRHRRAGRRPARTRIMMQAPDDMMPPCGRR